MAKMTQEMYGAEGRVGNKTYYRVNGKTVAREIVTPKNPKTAAQTYQRVIAKQVTDCYKAMKSICDHSFEGFTTGSACMNRFRKLNMRGLRERAAEIQAAGQSLAQFYQFQPIGSTKFVPAAVIISEGQLPKVQASISATTSNLTFGGDLQNTYASIVNGYGLKRGDQLTFCVVIKDDNGDYIFKVARVILDPRNADGSGAAMTSAFCADGAIVNPNMRNNGEIAVSFADGTFDVAFGENPVVAAAIIVSRKSKDYWFRSSAKLVIDEAGIGADLCGLETAVNESYTSDELYVESDLYLNNSGEGGEQGDVNP